MLTKRQVVFKRSIDILFAIIGLLLFCWIILFLMIIVFVNTGEKGIFIQERVGQYGNIFKIYKIRSIYKSKRLISFAKFIRKAKLDELPQLWNVLIGNMSIVGPRPDLKGFADQLQGEERIILNIKPGLTGPASLFFYNEEELLNNQKDKETYNRDVIWRKKVILNISYIKSYTITNDIKYVLKTFKRIIIKDN